MDILHLIDRLEALVTESFHLPFTANVIVQEDAFLDIIDQMRVSIPEEVKLAKRTEAERERLLLQAEEEANHIVEMAHEKADSLTDDHELVTYARKRAEQIEADAHRQAEEILADTDEYIIDKLSALEEELMRSLTTVRNGLRHVRETKAGGSIEALQDDNNDEEMAEPESEEEVLE